MNEGFGITKKMQQKIADIAREYSFALISEELLQEQLVNIIVDEYSNKESISIEDFAIKRLKEYCEDQVENILYSKKNLTLLNRFVTGNLSFTKKTDHNLKELQKLGKMLSKYNYILETDMVNELLECNEKLKEVLKEIADKNNRTIKLGKLEEIIEDNFTVSLIESYCMIQGIDMDDNSIEALITPSDSNYHETEDIVRMY